MIDLNDVAPARPLERYDLDAIVARLRATAETWVPRLFPNGRRVGDEWRLANIKGAPPRKQGSCVIALKGEHAGDWHDFDGNQGGGPLSTLEHATGLSGCELFAFAAEMVGLQPDAQPQRQAPAAASRPVAKDHTREIEFILSQAEPIAGTLAERYLSSRGLPALSCADLLFHPDVTHWESRRGFPCLVAIVRDHLGNRIALHRTYLADDGAAKAPIDNPRKMLGSTGRGAVRFADIANGLLGLAEGIETALSVMAACPHLPVWATLSASNLEQVVLPPEVHRIVILADHDGSGAGQRAAETAAHRLTAEGRRVWIALPSRGGEDFNDVLLRGGAAAVNTVVEQATEWPRQNDQEAPAIKAKGGTHRPIGFAQPAILRPMLRADDGDLAHATRRTWDALLTANDPPWLFRSGGRPAWAVRDDDGLPIVQPLTEDRMRSALAQLVDWRKLSRTDELVPAYPPAGVIKSILATPDPSLPVLAGLSPRPCSAATASSSPRRATIFPRGFSMTRPPGSTSRPCRRGQLNRKSRPPARSCSTTCSGIFRSRAKLSVRMRLHSFWSASCARDVEKPTQGTGATLMIDAISVIATGYRASVMVEGSDDEEWRKRLTAKLRQIPSLVLIDNLRRPLNSAALAAALTAPYWEDRVLRVSEITRLPIRCIWIATGNNPEFSGEMARRLVRIRLDARIDKPWRRSGFRNPI